MLRPFLNNSNNDNCGSPLPGTRHHVRMLHLIESSHIQSPFSFHRRGHSGSERFSSEVWPQKGKLTTITVPAQQTGRERNNKSIFPKFICIQGLLGVLVLNTDSWARPKSAQSEKSSRKAWPPVWLMNAPGDLIMGRNRVFLTNILSHKLI